MTIVEQTFCDKSFSGQEKTQCFISLRACVYGDVYTDINKWCMLELGFKTSWGGCIFLRPFSKETNITSLRGDLTWANVGQTIAYPELLHLNILAELTFSKKFVLMPFCKSIW